MKSVKKGKKDKREDKDQSDDDSDLEGGVKIQRSLMTEEQLNEVKPITQFFKTGDRVEHEKAPTSIAKGQSKEKATAVDFQVSSHTKVVGDRSGSGYTPLTKESRLAYDELANIINRAVPDQPSSFLEDCAFEVIQIIKNAQFTKAEKKVQIQQMLKINDDVFNKIVFFCGEINDFRISGNDQKEANREKEEGMVALTLNDGRLGGQKVEFVFEEQQVEDEVVTKDVPDLITEGMILEEPEKEALPDGNTLKRLLAEAGFEGKEAALLEENLLTALGLESEIDVQNALFELDSTLSGTLINELYERRHELYFGYFLDRFKDDLNQLSVYLDQASQIEQPSTVLRALISHYRNFTNSDNNSLRLMSKNAKSALDLLSLAEFIKTPKKLIPLKPKIEELISFATTPLKLPRNSVRVTEKGYEEIRIPHQLSSPDPNERLVRIANVPEYFREAFGDLKSFNRVQSKVFDFAFKGTQNMLLCAPTGAGKTIVSLLAILGLVHAHRDQKTQIINLSSFKVVYLAPMKALVAEVVATLNYRLNYLGIKASEFTGDIHLSRQEFEDATIIVSTPEKWDVLSRKTIERQFSDKLKLLIVDEIHLLGDSRGPVLEAVIGRTLAQKGVRIVGLSATLPNYADVANFMDVGSDGLFYFNNSFRPVPLSQVYIGVNERSGVKRVSVVREVLFQKVLERVKDHQLLIFVHSRKETAKTANELKETAFAENVDEIFVSENSKKIIEELKGNVINSELSALLPYGIGFHHAGLSRSDRKLVEDLFAGGHLTVLVSTATLAWGVNLPAHTVIIKNTQVYSPQQGKWVPLSGQNLLQMLGRAGRPGFDKEGEGIIITSNQELRHYISFLNEQEPIESGLLAALPESINAEVVGGQIQNFKDACNWLTRTFMYQRLKKNPKHYGLIDKIDNDETALATFVIDAVHTALVDLESVGLVRYNRSTGTLEATPDGRIASFFYLKPENVKIYKSGLENELDEIDLFKLFCSSVEFRNITIREEEKIELAKLYSSVPVPIKGPVDDPKSKVSVLLQCFISRVELEGYAINCDLKFVSENAQRIFRALLEIAIQKRSANCQLILDYCKICERRCWKDLSPLRQFAGVNGRTLQRLEQQEHLTFGHFKTMSVTQLNNIVRNDRSAEQVHTLIRKLPNLESSVFVQLLSRQLARVSIHCTPDFTWDNEMHGGKLMFRVFVMDVDQEHLLHHQPFFLYRQDCLQFREEKAIEFTLKISEPLPSHFFIKVVSDEWITSEAVVPVSLKGVFLPGQLPASLEAPVPSSESVVKAGAFLERWSNELEITQFTDFQNALFNTFYDTFEHLHVAAPKCIGKFTLALSALIRVYEEAKSAKSIILLPDQFKLGSKHAKIVRITERLGVTFGVLTGDLQTDIGIFSSVQVVLSTVKELEKLTRNYKKRPQIKEIRLVIAAGLFSGEETDSSYEVLLTRLRMIFSHTKQLHRIIALSTPIANPTTICEWLQVKPEFGLHFHSSCRNNEMNVLINTIDSIQSGNLVEIAARKSAALFDVLTAGNDGFLFVVDSVSDARSFSAVFTKELIRLGRRLALTPISADVLDNLSIDVFNANTIEYGVAHIYSGTEESVKEAVLNLWRSKMLKVLILTRNVFEQFEDLIVSGIGLINGGLLTQSEVNLAAGLLNRITDANFKSESENDVPKRNLLVFLRDWEKEQFKNKLSEPAIVESSLGFNFIEALNTQIASKAVQSKAECVSWLTWTHFYRRLTANPNYYNLGSDDPLEVSEYISELVDAGLADLQQSECIEIDGDQLSSESNGEIASFYDLKIPTVAAIAGSFTENFGWRSLLQVLASSSIASQVKLSPGEFSYFEDLNENIPLKVPKSGVFSSYFKVFVLLQAYCTRAVLPAELEIELERTILPESLAILNGVVAVATPQSLFVPAVLAIKLCKLLVQRLWHSDNTLKQLPFFTEETIARAAELGVFNLDDFLSMENEDRETLLIGFSDSEKTEMARFANAFPNVQIEAKIADDGQTTYEIDETVTLNVTITQESLMAEEAMGEEPETAEVLSVGLIRHKKPVWWLLVADRAKSLLFSAKRIQLNNELTKSVSFAVSTAGSFDLSVLLLSDSYVGFDFEAPNIKINVVNKSE